MVLFNMITGNKNVNHPSHYNADGRPECIEVIKGMGVTFLADFCLGNTFKYLYRAGSKDGNPEEQDIAKALWYWNYLEDVRMDLKLDWLGDKTAYDTVKSMLEKRRLIK